MVEGVMGRPDGGGEVGCVLLSRFSCKDLVVYFPARWSSPVAKTFPDLKLVM